MLFYRSVIRSPKALILIGRAEILLEDVGGFLLVLVQFSSDHLDTLIQGSLIISKDNMVASSNLSLLHFTCFFSDSPISSL